ncbi:hypothetical protein BDP27DRAFT_1416471 [Rhodocollybia butyracea]|uniref:DNA ligase ATP-dependent N-terminal domain-containing protein n=1 Tax=Rhodocollybia butyracea TaxID=206335 RepID=A0A9P5Q287_9AGAR|nr:hypothetical protein BDP27DRAFT_1416471 [Rhodocollybia butyracea]
MNFIHLARQIVYLKGKEPSHQLQSLRGFFEKYRQDGQANALTLLHLLLPHLDNTRSGYGPTVQTNRVNLSQLYTRALAIGDPDAQRLHSCAVGTGDMSEVIYDLVGKRSSVIESSCTVEQVDLRLTELSKYALKREKQVEVMRRVFGELSPIEHKVLVCIILKGNFHLLEHPSAILIPYSLRDLLFTSDNSIILTAYHQDAPKLYQKTHSLQRVVEALHNSVEPARKVDSDEKVNASKSKTINVPGRSVSSEEVKYGNRCTNSTTKRKQERRVSSEAKIRKLRPSRYPKRSLSNPSRIVRNLQPIEFESD